MARPGKNTAAPPDALPPALAAFLAALVDQRKVLLALQAQTTILEEKLSVIQLGADGEEENRRARRPPDAQSRATASAASSARSATTHLPSRRQ